MASESKRSRARPASLRNVAKSILKHVKENKLSFANKGELKAELSINKKLERRFALIRDEDDKKILVTFLWKRLKKKKKTGTPRAFLSREQSPETQTKKVQELLMENDKYISPGTLRELQFYNPEQRMWEETGYRRIEERATSIRNSYNMYRSSSVREVISLIHGLTMKPRSIFESTPHRITMQNGIWDWEKFKFDPEHRPEEYHTQAIPVTYDRKAKCSNNLQFFNEIAPNHIKTIQEIIGWLSYKEYFPKTFFILRGETDSGRTVFVSVIERFTGAKNCVNIPLQDFSKPYNAAHLDGKLMNVSDDIPLRDIRDESYVKMLSGGSRIPARKIYGSPFDYFNYAKLIFTTNRIPFAPDASNAFFNRTFIIDFLMNFPKGAPGTKHRPEHIAELTTPEELSGLFNWGIPGFKRLMKQGKFTGDDMTPEEKRVDWSERATQDLRLPSPARSSRSRRKNAADIHRRNRKLIWSWAEHYNWPDRPTLKRWIYREFVKACKARGIKLIPAKSVFGGLLKDHHYITEERPRATTKSGAKKRVECWLWSGDR